MRSVPQECTVWTSRVPGLPERIHHNTVLSCTVLYCTVLHNTILFCTVLYCFTLPTRYSTAAFRHGTERCTDMPQSYTSTTETTPWHSHGQDTVVLRHSVAVSWQRDGSFQYSLRFRPVAFKCPEGWQPGRSLLAASAVGGTPAPRWQS